jgi:hypothetical protein
MSKDPISEGDQDVSRRRLLEKAALAVGAATSLVTAGAALARSSNVVMDSAGRVLIDGATIRAQKPEGSFEEAAAGANDGCLNPTKCTSGDNKGCENIQSCVKPATGARQPTGAGPKVNAPPLTGPKVNAPLGGSSTGGGSRK